jgi:membrane protease YdiL (CAAX protease family)
MKLGLGILPFFALGIASGSIVYTWLYNNTKGSVFMAILFHGVFNFITASKAGEGLPAALISTVTIVAAVVLVLLKPKGLKQPSLQD